MDVVVAGGHGKIAQRLLRLLAEPVVCDMEMEEDLAPLVEGADAVVFAAGAGPGSGPERKRTVDLGAALKLIEAARARGIPRYLMVSAIGAGHPEQSSEQMRPYIEAKAEADAALQRSGLDFTIVRPGGLSDDPGTGRIRMGQDIGYGQVPRDDVAATLAAALQEPNAIGKTFDLLEGDTPVEEALRAL